MDGWTIDGWTDRHTNRSAGVKPFFKLAQFTYSQTILVFMLIQTFDSSATSFQEPLSMGVTSQQAHLIVINPTNGQIKQFYFRIVTKTEQLLIRACGL